MRLSTKYGLNPTVEVCWRCGVDTGAILLMGSVSKFKCLNMKCGATIYGRLPDLLEKRGCPKCGGHGIDRVATGVEAPRKATGGLCKACEKEVLEFNDEVIKHGGVHFRCTICHTEGIIKGESKLAKMIRAGQPEIDWNKIGYGMDGCPRCREQLKEEKTHDEEKGMVADSAVSVSASVSANGS